MIKGVREHVKKHGGVWEGRHVTGYKAKKAKERKEWRAPLERKFIDATLTTTALSTSWGQLQPTSGITDCLSCPTVGDLESGRDGRNFRMMSIHVNVLMSVLGQEEDVNPLTDIVYRLVLVLDTQTNATEMVAADVIDTGSTTDVLSWRNLHNSTRFKILHDTGPLVMKRHNSGNGSLHAVETVFKVIKFNHSFGVKGVKVKCNALTSGSVAAVTDNSIALLGVTTNALCLISYESRLRFTSA